MEIENESKEQGNKNGDRKREEEWKKGRKLNKIEMENEKRNTIRKKRK